MNCIGSKLINLGLLKAESIKVKFDCIKSKFRYLITSINVLY